MTVILGLDPGLAALGWGAIVWHPATGRVRHLAHGWVSTPPGDVMATRVDTLCHAVSGLLATYRPAHLAAEAWVWYGRSAGAGVHVMRVCGAIRALACVAGVPCTEYSARAIKQCVTGSANGEKPAVQRAVRARLGLARLPRPDHAADALGAALTHLEALRAGHDDASLNTGHPRPVVANDNARALGPRRVLGAK